MIAYFKYNIYSNNTKSRRTTKFEITTQKQKSKRTILDKLQFNKRIVRWRECEGALKRFSFILARQQTILLAKRTGWIGSFYLSRNTTKPTKWRVRPISLGIRPVWSIFAVHMNKPWE